MPPMSVLPARSPLQQLSEQLARGEITPRAAAEEALSRANSNASHNVYIALDAERNGVAHEDSAVAARLRSQGAIIIGKTHMHPLAYGITGENPDYRDCVQ